MTCRTYFRLSLFFPLCIPLLFWVAAEGQVARILMLSLAIGGIPYAVYAAMAWHILGRATATPGVPRVIVNAPILMLPLQLIAWLVQLLFRNGLSADIGAQTVGALFAFFPMAIYIVLLGYTYVCGTVLLFHLLEKTGQIKGSA